MPIELAIPTKSTLVVGTACLAQSVERQALNLMVEGSSPSVGAFLFLRLVQNEYREMLRVFLIIFVVC